MKYPDDIVIDIETVGKKHNAVIASIGAVIFNRMDKPGTIKDSFEVKIDICNQPGRVIEGDTVLWWMKENMTEARVKTFFSKDPKIRLGLGLKQLDDFVAKHRIGKCWGCGPDFDMVILQDAYHQHRQEFPVPFWDWACIRTIEGFFYGKNTRKEGGENFLNGTAHDALDDCKMEAMVVQNAHLALRNAIC